MISVLHAANVGMLVGVAAIFILLAACVTVAALAAAVFFWVVGLIARTIVGTVWHTARAFARWTA